MTGSSSRIAVEQPIVVTRAGNLNRCRVIKQNGTFDMQRDIVGRVGTHTGYLLIRHLIAVQRQNHSISYFQWTSQRTFTGQQLLIITCHMHNIVVL